MEKTAGERGGAGVVSAAMRSNISETDISAADIYDKVRPLGCLLLVARPLRLETSIPILRNREDPSASTEQAPGTQI